jgi:citrate lyase subunit beta/citryl-CoA lyase
MMSSDPLRPLRSALYLPASNQRAIEKSRSLAADAVIFDLEDLVAPDMKAAARANLVLAFEVPRLTPAFESYGNAADSPWIDDDLDTVATCKPDAVLLPKVSSEQDLVESRAARSIGAPEPYRRCGA